MTNPNKNLKIALIGFRLSHGGMEKVSANLSVFLVENGINAHHIIMENSVVYPYLGVLHNIGILKSSSNSIINKIKRFFALKKVLTTEKFDLIIDFRYRTNFLQELFIIKWAYNAPVIFTVHSAFVEQYLFDNKLISNFFFKKTTAIVALTNAMKIKIENKYSFKNVVSISNMVNVNLFENEPVNLNFNYILAIGQMENNIKQFDKLIETFAKTNLFENNTHLVILGEGQLINTYKKIAKFNKIEKYVHFLGRIENPMEYIKKAKILVVSSKNEGLPNVILEALYCQTPVITFDCMLGTDEVVKNQFNGIVVENQNFEALIEACELLINDENLYQICKKNCKESVLKFSKNEIGNQWLQLINKAIV